jgi:transcriptional regulator with XRE-family HTH domain
MDRKRVAMSMNDALKSSGLRYREVAEKAGVPVFSVAQARNPKGATGSEDRLRKIAGVVGLDLDTVGSQTDTPTPVTTVTDSFVPVVAAFVKMNETERRTNLVKLVQVFGESRN